MTVQAFVGRPRQGKSYSAVELAIIPALREGRIVYTNIPLLPAVLDDFPNADCRLLDLKLHQANPRFWSETVCNGALVVADELWRVWPKGLIPAQLNKRDDLEFIKEHGHLADDNGRIVDIILVTQNLDDIAKSIADMVDMTIISEKLYETGFENRFRRDYYKGPIYGLDGKKNKFIKSDDMVTYLPSVYKYYKSHTKASALMDKPNETKVISANIFGSIKFKLLIVGFVICLIILPVAFSSASKGVSKITHHEIQQPVNNSNFSSSTNQFNKSASLPSPPLPKPVPILSNRWRLSGYYSINGNKVAVINDGHHHTRYIDQKYCYFGLSVECTKDMEVYTSYSGQRDTGFSVAVPLSTTAVPVTPNEIATHNSYSPPPSEPAEMAAENKNLYDQE